MDIKPTTTDILLINTGRSAVIAAHAALPNAKIRSVYSRNIIVHTSAIGTVQCINRNTPLPQTVHHVFIRRRGTDEELCGIITEHYMQMGITVSDAINLSFQNAESKIAQMSRLAHAGVTVPESIVMNAASYNANRDYIQKHIQFPLVYKETGSRGEKVYLLSNESELMAHLNKLPLTQLCLIQTVIPNDFDTRTLVAYGTVIGSIKRIAKPGEFHNNFSRGGTIEAYTLTREETAVAILAARTCKLDFAGVDFIHTPTGPIVLEVNKTPQIKGFETIHGKDMVFNTIAKLWQQQFLPPQDTY